MPRLVDNILFIDDDSPINITFPMLNCPFCDSSLDAIEENKILSCKPCQLLIFVGVKSIDLLENIKNV